MKEIVQSYVKIYLFDLLFFLIKKFIIYFFVTLLEISIFMFLKK